jgi:hypothetical protein
MSDRTSLTNTAYSYLSDVFPASHNVRLHQKLLHLHDVCRPRCSLLQNRDGRLQETSLLQGAARAVHHDPRPMSTMWLTIHAIPREFTLGARAIQALSQDGLTALYDDTRIHCISERSDDISHFYGRPSGVTPPVLMVNDTLTYFIT